MCIRDSIQTLNGTTFSRIRFGVGNEFSKGKQVDYVLGQWSNEEDSALTERVDTAIEMIKSFVMVGAAQTMTLFNGK